MENDRILALLKDFKNKQEALNENFLEKNNKISVRVHEINIKAIPEVCCKIDKRNLEIEEIKQKIKELYKERVLPGEIKQLSNRLSYDIDRVKDEVLQVDNFLDNMLGIEISNGISDTLLQILDSRQIRKLVSVYESQISESKSPQLSPIKAEEQSSAEKLSQKTLTKTKIIENNLASAIEKLNKEDEEKKNQRNSNSVNSK